MVEIRQLVKKYRERTVLDLPELTFEDGETAALAGANGSGKTTLLRILAGVLSADGGEIRAPSQILYCPQNAYAFRGDLVENILLGVKEPPARALQLLEQMELAALAKKKASSLSGGELQRLALCRALIRPCRLLLLDEPTSACDAKGTALAAQAIRDYQKEQGCTVIFSTHAPAFALTASRLLVLEDGRLADDGTPETVLNEPKNDWAKSFSLLGR